MPTPCLRTLDTHVHILSGRARGSLLFLFLLLCFVRITSFAAVTVTTSSAGVNICSNKAITGSAPGFTALSTIMISEGSNADFNGAAGGVTNTIVLVPPTGWQFGTALPTFTFTTGSNVTAVTGSITATSLTINITANNTNGGDQVFIAGLQVQATSTTSASGNIYPGSVSGIAGISTGPSGTNFSTLSLTSPVTPFVSITASPVGAICPGTNVTFTPGPVNGGTSPVYQWYVNGSNMATGSTYNSSSLANGNTISCTMIPGGSCLTSTTAVSNTIIMTVNAAPAAIAGSAITCPGSSVSLSSTTTGGTWSSGTPSIAIVSTSGVVTGAAAGSAKISYTAGGCATVRTVYVNAIPSTPSLSPTGAVICSGGVVAITAAGAPLPSSILSQNFSGGISPWTVDSAGSVGVVPGAGWKNCGDGYTNEQGIYHSPDNSAFAMANSDTSGSASYTWSKLISPTFSLAGYSSATLSFQHAYEHWLAGDYNVDLEISTNGGASWSTLRSYTGSDVGMKTAFSADTVSLNAYLGYSNVKVRFNYYCHWGYYWAVDNIIINGISSIAYPAWAPAATLYSDPALTTPYVPGSLTNVVYASPTSVGSTSIITYTATSTIPGCSSAATSVVTVNPLPGTITGALNTCTSSTIGLTNTVVGGTWSSVNTSVASINATTGVVAGLTPGTTTISYSTGVCAATAVLTVNVAPAAIAGPSGICITSTVTLSDATTGGTWSCSNTAIASVGSSSGIVSGLTLGTAVITYSLGAGCTATKIITVNALPAAITGTATVCQGQTTTISNVTPGGTWSSGTTTIATVGSSTGVVAGISAGNTTITYTSAAGCIATIDVTVNPLASITGSLNVCVGQTTSLSNINSGGSWLITSSSASISSSGLLTGVDAGTAVVSYVLPTGCTATIIATVNSLPAAVTGTASICVGAVTTLSDTIPGGSWSSGNTTVASAAFASGVVTGITSGSANISYILPTGCITTVAVTVNPLPDSIIGSSTACVTPAITLSDATTGGTWSSSNTSVADVGVITGIVTGALPGIVNITYTLPTTCKAVKTLTIYPMPAAIVGTLSACVGATTTLPDPYLGGTWSGSTTPYGTVSMSTGTITGTSPGTLTITYTLPTGCYTTRTFTVNGLPDVISGPSSACLANTITLTNTVAGGVWSSGFSNVSVGSATGTVIGISTGTAIITYSLSTGCFTTKTIAVNSAPATILGPSRVCAGSTILLTDATPGGTWSSSNPAAGTINAAGVFYGLGNDTTTIAYTLPTGCSVTSVVTVNVPPVSIGASSPNVCLGLSITLTDGTPGGTWSSSNASIAAVGASSGIVTGYTIGTATITYTMSTGCFATRVVTVNSLPLAISGPGAVCNGYSILLTDLTPSGSWSSNNTSVATVGSASGVVMGVGTGSAMITYSLPSGCFSVKSVSVYPTPAAIAGTTGLCQGSTTTLSDATTGGLWSVGAGSVAAVNATTGVVTGLSPGTTLVSYTLGSCYAITTVTVNAILPPITGLTNICQGATTTLTNSVSGGSWISAGSIVTVGSASGIVFGASAGTTTVSYMLPTGCYVTTPFTVNTPPAAIAGPASLCVGSAAFYTNTTSGGTWTSSNPAVAVINASGLGVAYTTGTTNISYTLASGCATGFTLTVTPIPSLIVGPSTVCESMTITLSTASPGGTWSSSNTSVATVGTSGGVSGIVAGTANIIYTLGGCTVTKMITVNPATPAITGGPNACIGSSTPLSNAAAPGTWVSSNTAVAGINATSGMVLGYSLGTTAITFTSAAGCSTTLVVTVNSAPASITGPSSVCLGQTITLSNITSGGTWSNSGPVAAIHPSTGVVTAFTSGTSLITYTLGTGCYSIITVTANALPAPISGSATGCTGQTITLSDLTPGGAWSSGAPGIATVNTAGFVAGIASGTATITYALPTGCQAIKNMTVNPAPASITGTAAVCQGYNTTLGNSTPAGAWSSVIPGIATVSAAGVVTGMSDGIATISYTLANGCAATLLYTVHPLAPITGPANACLGQTTNLNNFIAGGSWSSSNIAIATIGSATGFVYGIALGSATMSYVMPTGCMSTKNITVNPAPAAITGASSACMGSTVALVNTTPGGMWSSSETAIAPISASGIVSGLSAGSAVIVYALSTGCATYATVTINPLYPIVGPSGICGNDTATFANAAPGGTWSSTLSAVATVNPITGLVTGLAPGTTIIRYLLSTGCLASKVVTINAQPSAASMTGGGGVCIGGAGVPVGLNSSSPGIGYKLFNGSSMIGSYPGTGASLSFGIFTTVGTYTVFATNATTGCTRNMSGAAVISVAPYNTPSVTVASAAGAVCLGMPATFVPVAAFAGTAPVYQWKVNGVTAGAGSSYTYVPASGDIVLCKLTSNAACLSTDTASGFMTVSVIAPAIPAVNIAATPGDTMCPLTTVTLTPTPVNGGSAPWYNWFVNGASAGVSATYSYAPLNADNVYCVMHSNQFCITSDTVSSNHKIFTVFPATSPTVAITASPGLIITAGTSVTLTAMVSGGGSAPAYQWLLNGIAIAGATNATYTSASFINSDSVSCTVTNTDMCAGAPGHNKAILTVKPNNNNNHTGIAEGNGLPYSLYLLPNPNAGIFTLQGPAAYEGEITVEVIDLLGQRVHRSALNTRGQPLNSLIVLDSRLANGMYILNVYIGGERHALHFIIEK